MFDQHQDDQEGQEGQVYFVLMGGNIYSSVHTGQSQSPYTWRSWQDMSVMAMCRFVLCRREIFPTRPANCPMCNGTDSAQYGQSYNKYLNLNIGST